MARWEDLFAAAEKKVSTGSIEASRLSFIRREFLDPVVRSSRDYNARVSVERETARRAAAKPVNLVANGSFETFDGWTVEGPGSVTLDCKNAVSKGGSLKLVATDAAVEGPYVRASAKRMLSAGAEKMKPNTRYRLSFFVKCENVKGLKRDAGVSLCFHDNMDHAAPARAYITGTTGWVHISVEFVSKKNTNIASMAFVQPRITNATGTAWFDDILIEEVKE